MLKYIFTLFVFFSTAIANQAYTPVESVSRAGYMIVGVGLCGCGKSSTFKELQKLLRCELFLEPEEEAWSEAIKEREHFDYFTALMSFRSMRIPMLYRAHQIKMKGGIALVDTYYDKILHYYIGKKGTEWLIDPNDPYFKAAKTIARLDLENLPDADVIVLFEIEINTWKKLLSLRGRQLDKDENFIASYHTYSYFREAAVDLCRQKNIKLIEFKQEFSSPEIQAKRLRDLIFRELGI